MATRIRGSEPINGQNTSGTGLSGAAVATVLTYTCPVGKQAKLLSACVGNFAGGTPTVTIFAGPGGTLISLGSGTANFQVTTPILINAGETIIARVTTLAVGSSFDANISVEEYLVS